MKRTAAGALAILLIAGCARYFEDTSMSGEQNAGESRYAMDNAVDSTEALSRVLAEVDEESYTLAQPEHPENASSGNGAPAGGPTSGKGRRASFQLESVHGVRREWKGVFRPHTLLTGGYRKKQQATSWYVTGQSRGVIRSYVVGRFKILMGEGILAGRGARFFNLNPKVSSDKRPLRITPSFSAWNSQQGAAVTFGMRILTADVALFEKYVPEAGCSPRMILLGATRELTSGRFGAAVLTPVRWDGSGQGAGRALHGFITHSGARLRVAGEAGLILDRFAGAVRVSVDAPVTLSARIYRVPDGNVVGDWLETMRRASSACQGGGFTLRRRHGPLRPGLSCHTSIQSKPAYTKQSRLLVLEISGSRRGAWAWDLRAMLSDSRKLIYPTRVIESAASMEKTSGLRLKGSVTIRGGRLSQTIGWEGRISRWGRRPRAARLSTAVSVRWKPFSSILKVSCYTVKDGRPLLISRPGMGSFEYFSWTNGENGTDVSLRVQAQISSTMRLVAFYGHPWMDERRFYIGARWKYQP